MNGSSDCAAGAIRDCGRRLPVERLTRRRIDHHGRVRREVAGALRERRNGRIRVDRRARMVARVVQEERRARAAVVDVRDRQRPAERGSVPLLHVVRLLANASVEGIRRRVEHRAAQVVVRVALDASAAAAHSAEPSGPAAESAGAAPWPAAAASSTACPAAAEAALIAAAKAGLVATRAAAARSHRDRRARARRGRHGRRRAGRRSTALARRPSRPSPSAHPPRTRAAVAAPREASRDDRPRWRRRPRCSRPRRAAGNRRGHSPRLALRHGRGRWPRPALPRVRRRDRLAALTRSQVRTVSRQAPMGSKPPSRATRASA